MIIYYANGQICINVSGDIFGEPDITIDVTPEIITVITDEGEVEFERGNYISAVLEDDKIIIDFDADTEELDGLELINDVDASEVLIKQNDEVVMEITEDGVRDQEEIADDEAVAEGKKCKVGDEYFESLADAFATAQPGEALSIKMLDDEEGPGIGLFKADGQENLDITIDFNDHTYTATSPAVGSKGTQSQALHLEMNNKVTLKNGAFTADPSASDIKMLIQNYCDLTLDNMICDCSEDPSITYVCSNNFGNCLIQNSEIKAHPSQVAVDCWFGLGKTYDSGLTVTIKDSTIDSKIEYGAQGAALKREGNENWFERAVLTISGSDFGSIVNSGAGADDAHTIIIDGQKREQALPIVANEG